MAENFDKMRRDAILRTREMYAKAKLPHYEFKDDPRNINLGEKEGSPAEFSQSLFTGNSQEINVKSGDAEFNLLLNLINILAKENADKSLLFALFYIMG